jgi:membrane protease YdiL (CAAX protease family)
MKLFKILSHPYTLIVSFLFIVISGEHLGGFYALYVLLGLLQGAVHSLLGFFGIIVLLATYHSGWEPKSLKRKMLNIVGVGLLFSSVYFFFANDTERYNWGTFEQSVPLFTLFFTGFIALCFLVGAFWNSQSKNNIQHGILSKV